MTTNRYMTPLKYKDGNGQERRTKVHFELDPIELMDWTLENPFEANEMLASFTELEDTFKEDSRDLTRDEIRTLLSLIKLLAGISAGRPTDDGDYFLKDPNWTSSYAYRGFREFLLKNPKEMEQFMSTLLNGDVLEQFTRTLTEENTKRELEAQERSDSKQENRDSGPDTVEKMREKIRLLESQQND